ncbi:MAG: SGNH/GDSL hydrolase family protein [Gallionellaceae bacterium]|nr:SGNH/GDSL hydrolase family protein [Gallionellaceae bacterium]
MNQTMGKNKASWAINIGLVVVSIAVILGILEIIVRVFVEVPPSVVVENLNKPGEVQRAPAPIPAFPVENGKVVIGGLASQAILVYTPTGLRLRPNANVLVKNHMLSRIDVEIATNSLGYRHHELGEKKETDYRVLALGDSIMWSDYLPNEQAIPSYIEKALNEAHNPALKNKTLDVINAAIGSLNTRTEMAILLESGLSVKPDVVLVGLYLNDARETPMVKVTRLPSILTSSHLLRYLFSKTNNLEAAYQQHQWEDSIENVLSKEKDKFEKSWKMASTVDWDTEEGFNRGIYENIHDWGYAWNEGFWTEVLDALDMMHDISKDKGFKLVVVLLPVRQQVQSKILRNEPQQRFNKEMTKRGIAHLELLTPLREKYLQDKVDVYFDHCHMKPEGNELVGKSIARLLNEQI